MPANPPVPPAQTATLQIPPEVQAKFSDLITLIAASESMNAEERQYWVNILPIMTPEQLQNLRDILDNEKRQLASIDAKYQTQINQAGSEQQIQQTDEERRKKRQERQSKESAHHEEEEKAAEALLQQMDTESPKKEV